MDALAAFVFAAGGVARPDELDGLFAQQPALRAQLAAPTLKRAVARDGAAHGLAWRDQHPRERGAVVTHELTPTQRASGARKFKPEARRVPAALDAIEQFVRGQAAQTLRCNALPEFYDQFPLESAFMKRRSGGVVAFVQQYDPGQRRLCSNEDGSLRISDARVEESAPEDSEAVPFERLGATREEQTDEAHAAQADASQHLGFG